MRVSARHLVVLLALVVGLALAAPSIAKNNSTTFTLSGSSKLAGSSLPPGDYQVAFSDTTATFRQHGKVVAEAKGEWKKSPAKEAQDSIVRSSDGSILEIHIQGRDSYFVVG